ncbi:hypothetical protein LTR37_000221 [Vermiconidia calcicola]|uniref:Uncharacterized protein n=1 Tax=Vermiconidia calcicola TaxID=1690605 RepID=A0ACC3P0T5_9PEZI|nr:hypothetical protein LTR37_000221 [Vermiconidia calcicola]
MGSMARQKDTHIVFASTPFYGHVRPLRSLAKTLAGLGHPITFICGNTYKSSLNAINGVEFVGLEGKADFDPDRLLDYFPERFHHAKETVAVTHDIEFIFFGCMNDQHNALQNVLNSQDLASQRVVVISDACFTGTLPMLLGSPQARRVPCVGVANFPLFVLSKNAPPFGSGLIDQGLDKNAEMNAAALQSFSGVSTKIEEMLRTYECTGQLPTEFPPGLMEMMQDRLLQLCIPALELPRSDLPEHPLPQWWRSFVADDNTSWPLIALTQGTMPTVDPNELILPTINACKDLPVRLVVCAVHASLPASFTLPANVRWAEWIPFEDLFKHTSLVISNGGYGGINQALTYGIPMIIAGRSGDKLETTLRAELTKAAINLGTQSPSTEQIKDAVEKILEDKWYKSNALELKSVYAQCDAVGSFIQVIDDLVAEFYGKCQ